MMTALGRRPGLACPTSAHQAVGCRRLPTPVPALQPLCSERPLAGRSSVVVRTSEGVSAVAHVDAPFCWVSFSARCPCCLQVPTALWPVLRLRGSLGARFLPDLALALVPPEPVWELATVEVSATWEGVSSRLPV